MHSPHSLMLPAATQSLHPIYTLFKDPEGGMVGMECQEEMVEMEPQGEKERGETLVCRDHLDHKVATHSSLIIRVKVIAVASTNSRDVVNVFQDVMIFFSFSAERLVVLV